MDNWRAYLVELIGTFFLVLTIALAGNPIAVGAVIAAMVYTGGHISGAHFNPAVTLAVWLRGDRIDPKNALIYMFSQVLGGVLAAGVFYLMAGNSFLPESGNGLPLSLVLTVEVLFTFALALTTLQVATNDKLKDNQFYGLAIGLVIVAGGFAAGPISGGVFNPAVGLGTLLVGLNDVINDSSKLTTFLSAYLAAPLAGGILAALVYRLVSVEKA